MYEMSKAGVWGMVSRFGAIFRKNRLTKSVKEQIVGKDQFGNVYYERPADTSKEVRMKRWLKPPYERDMSILPEVPNEWRAWLQMNRHDPPTPEEIAENERQMLRTKMRAKELESKRAGEQPETAAQLPSGSSRRAFPQYDEYEVSAGDQDKRE